MYDVVVIGGGPAGITAAIFSNRRSLKTIILNDPTSLSQIEEATIVDDWPSIPNISGMDLMKKFKDHAKSLGVEMKEEKAAGLENKNGGFLVKTEKGTYETRTVIMATGARHRKAMVKGESEFAGKGVSYCASCDAPLFRGKKVLVIGGGDAAVKSAILLQQVGADTTMVHRRDELRAAEFYVNQVKKSGVKFEWDTILKEIKGGKLVTSAVLQNVKTQEKKEVTTDGIFVVIGTIPTAELAKLVGVEANDRGYIKVDREMKTNIEGFFAAGDCTDGPSKKIATAVGDGAIAAESAYNLIKSRE
jgi:thioredoxin reductase (NADPH)